MSKQIKGSWNFINSVKDGIKKNAISSLLISASLLAGELSPDNFIYWISVTAGYIVFDRIVRLFEIPRVIELDTNEIKSGVIEREENFRFRALLSKMKIDEQKAKIISQVALKSAHEHEEIAKALGDLELLSDNVESIITNQIDIPFKEFLLKEGSKPPASTIDSVNKKFSEIEVLKEGEEIK